MNQDPLNRFCEAAIAQAKIVYLDAYGELHAPDHIRELIEKIKTEDHIVRHFRLNGCFSGTVISSDLTIKLL